MFSSMKKWRSGLVLLQYFPTLFILCIPSLWNTKIQNDSPHLPRFTQVNIPQDPPHSRAVELLETGAEGLSAFNFTIFEDIIHIQIQISNQFRNDSIPVVCRYSYSHTYPKLTKSGRLALPFPTHPNPGLSQPTWTMICRHLAEQQTTVLWAWRNMEKPCTQHKAGSCNCRCWGDISMDINGVSKAWGFISLN